MLESIKEESQRILSTYEEVVDIILYGSATRGSEFLDIDLFVIHTLEDTASELKLNESILSLFPSNVHVTLGNIKTIFEGESIYKTLFHEGYSIKNKKKLSELIGLRSYVLFVYNLKSLDKTKKTRFSHALNGRNDTKGLIKTLNGVKIGNTSLYVSIDKYGEVRDFFDEWGIDYNEKRIWM